MSLTFPPPDNAVAETDALSRGMLKVLARRWPLIVIGLALGLAGGALLYRVMPPAFASNSQLLLIKKRTEGIGAENREPAEDYVSTHQALLRSPLLIDRTIQLGSLADRPALATGSGPLAVSLQKQLSVTRQKDSMGGGTNLLSLSFRAADPADANAVLDALIQAYQEMLDGLNARATDEARELFVRAHDVLQKELSARESAYRDFRKKAPLLWKGKDGVNTPQERLLTLETRRTQLLLREAEVQGKLSALEAAVRAGRDRETLLAMAADFAPRTEAEGARPTQAGRWQEQVLTLLQQEKKLLEKLGPEHPEVVAVHQSLAMARAFLNQPAAAGSDDLKDNAPPTDPVQARLASLRQELEHLKGTGALLASLCTAEQERARTLSAYEVEDEMHRNEIQRTQQLFETLLKRLQDANLVKDAGGYEVRVIARPGSDGVRQVQPSLLIVGSAALLFGLLLGGGLVLLAEMRDQRYRSPEEVRAHLGVPVLGVVPRLPRRVLRANQPVALEAPASPAAEAFRGVRAALLAGLGEGSRVIQISSAGPRQGKTLLAVNLGIVAAQAGRRVVVVDAHLTQPSVAAAFGKTQRRGLLAVLQGQATLEQAVTAGPVPGLTLLLTEAATTPSGDWLASAEFTALLGDLRRQFDLVLVDGPPALTLADAATLATRTDGVLLVLDAPTTMRPDMVRTLDSFAAVRAPVLGMVVNRMPTGRPFPTPRPVSVAKPRPPADMEKWSFPALSPEQRTN